VNATPEQERQWIAELERMGVVQVKGALDRKEITPGLVHLSYQWLSDKEREAKSRAEASKSEQMELMRRSSSAADRAADAADRAAAAAERASTAAERQAFEAERANRRASIALAIAITSIAATIISIFVTHWDARK
jgi:hypothetical protein